MIGALVEKVVQKVVLVTGTAATVGRMFRKIVPSLMRRAALDE